MPSHQVAKAREAQAKAAASAGDEPLAAPPVVLPAPTTATVTSAITTTARCASLRFSLNQTCSFRPPSVLTRQLRASDVMCLPSIFLPPLPPLTSNSGQRRHPNAPAAVAHHGAAAAIEGRQPRRRRLVRAVGAAEGVVGSPREAGGAAPLGVGSVAALKGRRHAHGLKGARGALVHSAAGERTDRATDGGSEIGYDTRERERARGRKT